MKHAKPINKLLLILSLFCLNLISIKIFSQPGTAFKETYYDTYDLPNNVSPSLNQRFQRGLPNFERYYKLEQQLLIQAYDEATKRGNWGWPNNRDQISTWNATILRLGAMRVFGQQIYFQNSNNRNPWDININQNRSYIWENGFNSLFRRQNVLGSIWSAESFILNIANKTMSEFRRTRNYEDLFRRSPLRISSLYLDRLSRSQINELSRNYYVQNGYARIQSNLARQNIDFRNPNDDFGRDRQHNISIELGVSRNRTPRQEFNRALKILVDSLQTIKITRYGTQRQYEDAVAKAAANFYHRSLFIMPFRTSNININNSFAFNKSEVIFRKIVLKIFWEMNLPAPSRFDSYFLTISNPPSRSLRRPIKSQNLQDNLIKYSINTYQLFKDFFLGTPVSTWSETKEQTELLRRWIDEDNLNDIQDYPYNSRIITSPIAPTFIPITQRNLAVNEYQSDFDEGITLENIDERSSYISSQFYDDNVGNELLSSTSNTVILTPEGYNSEPANKPFTNTCKRSVK